MINGRKATFQKERVNRYSFDNKKMLGLYANSQKQRFCLGKKLTYRTIGIMVCSIRMLLDLCDGGNMTIATTVMSGGPWG